jgi:hypothetical protein
MLRAKEPTLTHGSLSEVPVAKLELAACGRRLAQVALGTTAQHCKVRDLAALCGAGRLCMACSADERKANGLQH